MNVPGAIDPTKRSTASLQGVQRMTHVHPAQRFMRKLSAATYACLVVLCGAVTVFAIPGASAASLPDGRAYELVSPAANKNGGDVIADTGRTRIASDGNGAVFSSLSAFGDAAGTGVATEYMSLRTASADPGNSGWDTHAIMPAQKPLGIRGVLASDPFYVGDLSPDLDQGVFRAWTPLTDAPGVANVTNFYLRSNLRATGQATSELVTPCPLCDLTAPLPPTPDIALTPWYAGASADFRHVAIQVNVNLTSDAPPQPVDCATDASVCEPRAYNWDEGQLHYTGLIPSGGDTSCGGSGPPCVAAALSIPGQSVIGLSTPNRPVNVVSKDGARTFFTVPGSPNGRSGRIYVRTRNTTTDEITASERTDCAGDATCGGNGVPDPAPDAFAASTYWGASVDGSRVFFTTTQELTDDTPFGDDRHLYMYDTTKAASAPDNLTYVNVDRETTGGDVANDVLGVIAESDDGTYVYFVATGQLVAGEPLLGTGRGIYAWHEGEIAYIGEMKIDETGELFNTSTNYTLRSPQTRVTPDGRHLLLSAHDGSGFSLRYDHGSCQTSFGSGCRELYVYSADTQVLSCVSCSPTGEVPTTQAASAIRGNPGAASTTWHFNRAISDDGGRVFFTTGESLLSDDTNGRQDVYQYDVPTGQVHLITSGTDPADSYFIEVGPSGDDVFFVTRERLVGWDTDMSYDLYDARLHGGFPDPTPPAPGCSGPACQGTPAAPPAALRVGSDALAGAGDVAPLTRHKQVAKACKKGYVKKRVRGNQTCVKRRASRSKHAVKRAGIKQGRGK